MGFSRLEKRSPPAHEPRTLNEVPMRSRKKRKHWAGRWGGVGGVDWRMRWSDDGVGFVRRAGNGDGQGRVERSGVGWCSSCGVERGGAGWSEVGMRGGVWCMSVWWSEAFGPLTQSRNVMRISRRKVNVTRCGLVIHAPHAAPIDAYDTASTYQAEG